MEGHSQDLRVATVETLHSLLDRITEESGIPANRLGAMVLSGNTTMIHFLLGLDAWTVFADPYTPVVTDPGFFWGRELDLDFSGLVYIVPAASNYIGGDIISGLIKLDIHKKDETSLFFDIGTNGELVLGNRHWMVAGAGAAGPALEGYISRFGMRAEEGEYAVVYAQGERTLFFSQTDIHQYLDTKAAAYTMGECLMESAGVSMDGVDKLYLSGAFAAHSKVESAVAVGMYPDLSREKYLIEQNTSLDGARILLLNRKRREEAEELAQNLYCVQFASIPDFLVRMQAAKFVPHTDMSRYPSLQQQIKIGTVDTVPIF